MELVPGTNNFASEENVINSMPEIMITNILDRLSIKDAVRTSILSTSWRFKWTLLSQLVFDPKFFKDILGAEEINNHNFKNVIGFLLHLKGSITKFVLHLPRHMRIDVEDINHWFLFLSGKGIKDVTIINWHDTPLALPSHLFSCLELKHLTLYNCSVHPPSSFHGFPNLLGLQLSFIEFENHKFGELITHCPLLKALSISDDISSGKVFLAEIAKLKNLEFLDLALRKLEFRPVTSFSILQLVGSLPKLQDLNLNFEIFKLLAEAGARQGGPISFPCLKRLELYSIDFGNDVMVSYVFEMICCSPNLQTLDILGSVDYDVPPTALSSSALGRNTMGRLQLQNIVFSPFGGSENELCLIKSLLASSPLLKKMHIRLDSSLWVGLEGVNVNLANKLLKLYRASPVAEIELASFKWF